LGRRSQLAGLDRSTALLLAAEGARDEAVRLLDSAIEVYRRLALPMELARTLVTAATVHRRLRRRAAAQRMLTEATQICRQAEAAPWLERINAEYERVGVRRDRAGQRSLSPVEARIVALVTAGATNRQIAGALSISVKTVEGAISRIYRKLGVGSRVELVRSQTVDR
jgi:DNA-binding CsgD family transcriptional regulator